MANQGSRLFSTLRLQWCSSYLDYLINYSTLCVKVNPHFSFDLNIAGQFVRGGFRAEAGYNLYAKKAEEICFDCPMKGGIGITALRAWMDSAVSTTPETRSLALIDSPIFKIENNPAGDPDMQLACGAGQNNTPTYRPITIDNLEKLSAAAPGMLSQTLYGSLGYIWNCEYPVFVNGGISYEFANDNTSVNRWLAWFKVGLAI